MFWMPWKRRSHSAPLHMLNRLLHLARSPTTKAKINFHISMPASLATYRSSSQKLLLSSWYQKLTYLLPVQQFFLTLYIEICKISECWTSVNSNGPTGPQFSQYWSLILYFCTFCTFPTFQKRQKIYCLLKSNRPFTQHSLPAMSLGSIYCLARIWCQQVSTYTGMPGSNQYLAGLRKIHFLPATWNVQVRSEESS